EVPETKQETTRPPGVWQCTICTYDNDESMTSCDICGVIRRDFVTTVEDKSKTSGASKLARSLFASLPKQNPKEVVLFPKQDDGFQTYASNFCKHGNVQGEFHESHKAFNTKSHSHLNIAPFKFDVPSPDDVVYTGLHSSKTGSKDKDMNSKTSRVSSSITVNEHTVQSNVESLENLTSLMQKGRQDRSAESKLSKKPAVHVETSEKTSNANNKNGTLDIRSTKGKTGSSSAMLEVKGSDEINFSSIRDGQSESLSSSFNKVAVDARSGNSDNTNAKGSHPQVSYKPEKWMLPQQAEDTLTQLNLAIGKGSFAYAWALDESSEERERGITMTVAVAYFDTKKYHVVVLDSPGHKDFVPNMISGATQADAAILVIDGSCGSFEAGMDSGKGQTREHAQLIRSFGVDQVIVAVNKMDTVAYAKDRFDYIRQQLGMFLRTCGFKDSSVSWIPMSAMENQNLVAPPSEASLKNWYDGPYLLDAIDSLPPPTREYSKPLIMPICDVIKLPTLGQVSACGKLEAGALRSGSKVLVMPAAVMGTVRSLERDSNASSVARAGDNVAVTLQGVDGSNVIAGGVLCHPDFPVAVANHLELKVLVLDGASPILMGSQLEFHIHHAKEPARVSRISSVLDPKTGKVTKKSPRCLTAKQSAVIEVTLQKPVCVVDVSICKALGRVSLRSSGRTIAVGLVTRIIEEQH
ncbi:hypothetical protein PIB30_093004, partial [Stylosanthes scabra]|nr:hypothetical protein [Stylosanthes scabra]